MGSCPEDLVLGHAIARQWPPCVVGKERLAGNSRLRIKRFGIELASTEFEKPMRTPA